MARAHAIKVTRGVALLLVDVINAFDFEGSGSLAKAASRQAPKIRNLAKRAREEGIPVIYVNDNFGQWRSDFHAIVDACSQPGRPGASTSEMLRPTDDDYFVLKPQHSGFYGTALDLLLAHLEARTLVVTGFAANICVVFTANDAHVRGYHVVVPSDCTAANTAALKRQALTHVRVVLHGDTRTSMKLDFDALAGHATKWRGQAFG